MTDLERIDALLAEQEKTIRNAFYAYLKTVANDGPVLKAILDKLEAGDVEGALKIVDSHVLRFGAILPHVSQTVGVATAAELAAQVPDVALAITFDPSFPRAAEIIRSNGARMVREFTTQQRAATVQALDRAYQEGTGTVSTARAFRESIGLTSQQEGWVNNYRKQLLALDRKALDRQARDRRFDRTVVNAIEAKRPLTEKQIDNMVERYRKRFLQLRAETIARTEGVRATSQAREESMHQMMEQTGIAPTEIERIWNDTHDKRTRDWHRSMHGQIRAPDVPFEDGLGNLLMYPGDPSAPAETVISCRCALTFRVRPRG